MENVPCAIQAHYLLMKCNWPWLRLYTGLGKLSPNDTLSWVLVLVLQASEQILVRSRFLRNG